MSENVEEEGLQISPEKLAEIKAEVKKLQKKYGKITVIATEGDEPKPVLVAYMRPATIAAVSRFSSQASKNEVLAAKGLAEDLFVGGDKELLTDDEAFLFGLMPNIDKIMKIRQSKIVNF